MVLVHDGCDKQIDIIMKTHEIQLRNNEMRSELHEYFLMLPESGTVYATTQLIFNATFVAVTAWLDWHSSLLLFLP